MPVPFPFLGSNVAKSRIGSLCLFHCFAQQCQLQRSGVCQVAGWRGVNGLYALFFCDDDVVPVRIKVEWMSEKVMRMFEDSRSNPFQFKHITLCHNLDDLSKVPDPKVGKACSIFTTFE